MLQRTSHTPDLVALSCSKHHPHPRLASGQDSTAKDILYA